MPQSPVMHTPHHASPSTESDTLGTAQAGRLPAELNAKLDPSAEPQAKACGCMIGEWDNRLTEF